MNRQRHDRLLCGHHSRCLLYDYLYGRLVGHVYHHPNTVGFGIQRGTALTIMPMWARVLGDGAVMVIDGRYVSLLAIGDNDVIAANWLLIDTFAPHQRLWTFILRGARVCR